MSPARSLALALAGWACFGVGSNTARAANLKVDFNPDRAGARTTIQLTLHISNTGETPVPVSSLDLRLPTGMGIATSTLGESNCNPANLLDLGLPGCSPNARIGHGEATVVVPVGSEDIREETSLNALMGPAVEDHLEVLFYTQGFEPVLARLMLPGVLQENPSSHAEELDTSIPLIQAWPEGPNLALETFNSTIGPSGLTYFRQIDHKKVVYHPHGIRIPAQCPSGGYPFSALVNFQNGSHATATHKVPCPPR